MFDCSLTDLMALYDVMDDCQFEGLTVHMCMVHETYQVNILIKENNDFPLASKAFDQRNVLGAIHFLINIRNDYRSWK